MKQKRKVLEKLQPVPRRFFARGPESVARDLLGKVLVREGEVRLVGRIVEVEAYLGAGDPSAHSSAGKTARTSVLFGPPGHAYVYFIYGNHYCLNVSCEPEGKAGSVLIRALEPLSGIEQMLRARGFEVNSLRNLKLLTSGPGRLAQAFGITRTRDNGVDLTFSAGGLWIASDRFEAAAINVTPRIGIRKAIAMPLRFLLEKNAFVSKRPSALKTPA